ncbi:hypothetical protein [Microbacterium sp. ZW T5_56]|uniref:hypothetical protein n=1 Tax=Microbacterium sp. ZW T5_56 TaxID=3378081 RepID=UPI00385365CE
MKFKQRIAGVLVVTGILVGGSIVAAAPAQAAVLRSPLYATKSQCVTASWVSARNFIRQGYILYGGSECAKVTVNGKTGWRYETLYRRP